MIQQKAAKEAKGTTCFYFVTLCVPSRQFFRAFLASNFFATFALLRGQILINEFCRKNRRERKRGRPDFPTLLSAVQK